MAKNILQELTEIVGEREIQSYRQRNKHFRDEYTEVIGNIAKEKYGIEPIVEVVSPRDPFIDSRVLVLAPEKESSQKYDLLQTFGDGYISTVDVVSLPEGMHDKIQEEYIQNILKQFPWYYIAGGHIEFKDGDKIKIHDTSGDFGKSMAGYDANSIAAYVLNLTQKFRDISVEKETSLKTNADDFFDMWLELFKESTYDGNIDNFFKEAYRVHREKSSAPLSRKYLAEVYVSAMNDPRAEEDIFHAITENMFEVQRGVFQEAIKRNIKK